MKQSALFACWSALVASALAFAGCVGAPEHCRGCIAALADGSALEAPRPDAPIGTGGATGSGGTIGSTGGMNATGGTGGVTASGGMTATGGAASGGMTGTGGRGTGGVATGGGTASGGMGSGGTGTGGANTGGRATGGAASGGIGTGGAASGGMGTGGANTGGANTGGAATDPDLVVWYKFDNNSTDSAMLGGTSRNATTTNSGGGSAAYSTTHQVGTHSLNLTGNASDGGYATVPNLQSQLPGAVTIACWVNLKSQQTWQRVFDFGTTAATPLIYMFLTTNQAMNTPNSVRFAISTNGNGSEQVINMSSPGTLSTNAWHHLAVVLPAGATYTGTLYIDGAVAGTNNAMTLHPSGIAMPNSFIGQSQFPDPFFNGYIDDFRVYRRALSAAEITALRAVTQ